MCFPTLRIERGWRGAVASALVVLLLGAGCGDPMPPAPSDPYAGSWSGSIADSVSGSGTLRMTLSGQAALTGDWSVMIAGLTRAGTVGELPPGGGTGRSFGLLCSSDPLQGGVVLRMTVDGSTATGSYQSSGCMGLTAGTMRLTRQ